MAIGPIEATTTYLGNLMQKNSLHETQQIGILATPFTVKSGYFADKLAKFKIKPNNIIQQDGGDFVKAIEHGLTKEPFFKNYVEQQVKPLNESTDIILGCTHYPFISQEIRQSLPTSIVLHNPADYLAETVRGKVAGTSLFNNIPGGNIEYFTTGSPAQFLKYAKKLPLGNIYVDKANQALI